MNQKQPCSNKVVRIKNHALPISCPQEGERLWNAHPKIYLPLSITHKEARCPYCETLYILED